MKANRAIMSGLGAKGGSACPLSSECGSAQASNVCQAERLTQQALLKRSRVDKTYLEG